MPSVSSARVGLIDRSQAGGSDRSTEKGKMLLGRDLGQVGWALKRTIGMMLHRAIPAAKMVQTTRDWLALFMSIEA